LNAAIRLFLENGYQATKITDITNLAKVDSNAVARVFGDKETLVAELIEHVFNVQTEIVRKLLGENCDDLLLDYVVESALRLYMAESTEQMREMYNMSYTCGKSSFVIYDMITRRLEGILKEYLPSYDSKDFYELEIATGGIMRSFIAVPCDRYFTLDRKIDKFIEYVLLLFRIPSQECEKVKKLAKQVDYARAVEEAKVRLIETLPKIK
jgi:AcrR family transcriptional regulator